MTEFDPNGPNGDDHDLTPPADLPEHHLDDRFAERHTPPLDDLGSAPATAPDALHFPGDDATVDDAAPGLALEADPTAAYPDDAGFSEWLAGSELAGPDDDPAADAELRDTLAPPSDDPGDLPTSDALVDWTMRRMGG